MRSKGGDGPLEERFVWRLALWLGVERQVQSCLSASSISRLCIPILANSDGASVILEGKALLGNFTLTHWALSLDSFWLVDAPVLHDCRPC